MRTTLTEAQIEQYRCDGFLVVDGLLDADELDTWRVAVAKAVEERGARSMPPGRADDSERELSEDAKRFRRYYDKVFTQRINLWQTSEAVGRLVLDERLAAMAATLAGVEGIRLWHDQALIKPPYGNPTALHLDVPYWSFHSPDAISVWVALDDATAENGCLCYLPGSHRLTGTANVNLGPDLGALLEAYPELAEIEPVHCPVKAGAAVFHNGLTAHGAGANMTTRPRRAMTVQYMPDGATFNGAQNILPGDYMAELNVGDVLDNDAHNPLLYRR